MALILESANAVEDNDEFGSAHRLELTISKCEMCSVEDGKAIMADPLSRWSSNNNARPMLYRTTPGRWIASARRIKDYGKRKILTAAALRS